MMIWLSECWIRDIPSVLDTNETLITIKIREIEYWSEQISEAQHTDTPLMSSGV
jgi:hypothetical protein